MRQFYEWREAPAAEFAVIGDPVSHSLSPLMHGAALRALGLPYRYVAVRVPPGEVCAALEHLEGLGYVGVNVTVPHKQEVLACCENVEPLAQKARAGNTVRLRSSGTFILGGAPPALRVPRECECINTDAPGFLESVKGLGLHGKRVLLLGAGGSARAIALALSEAAFEVSIYNRTLSRAEELVESTGIKARIVESPEVGGKDMIVNSTSASLRGDVLQIDWSQATATTIAYDLMYGAQPTPFLRDAQLAGLRIVDGLPLLVAQGALALEWWLGRKAPREVMTEAVRSAS